MDVLASLDEAQNIILRSVGRLETERTGIINALGRTLAEGVFSADGELMLAEGAHIGPAEMGLLAALGRQGVAVARRPRVSVITSGDELVDLMERLEPGKVRNSNRYCLAGYVFSTGCELGRLLYVADSHSAVRKAVESVRTSDAVITTGGVSSDGSNCVLDVLSQMGEMLVSKVAIEPGMETSFAIVGGKPVFALPGDPAGVAVSFELLVRPALLKMLGRTTPLPATASVILREDIQHTPGRRGFVHAVSWFESGRLVARRSDALDVHKSIADANCLVVIPEEKDGLKAGEEAQAIMLREGTRI